eukprot:3224016-Pleurochrysis_carterae.AAC.3
MQACFVASEARAYSCTARAQGIISELTSGVVKWAVGRQLLPPGLVRGRRPAATLSALAVGGRSARLAARSRWARAAALAVDDGLAGWVRRDDACEQEIYVRGVGGVLFRRPPEVCL